MKEAGIWCMIINRAENCLKSIPNLNLKTKVTFPTVKKKITIRSGDAYGQTSEKGSAPITPQHTFDKDQFQSTSGKPHVILFTPCSQTLTASPFDLFLV